MELHDSVRRTIRRHGMLARGSRVLVALSGGADSVALLAVLRDLGSTEGFQLAGVAHLNHQLRGADADLDEHFCRDVVSEAGLAFDIERVDVGRLAADLDVSIEQAAHLARHDYYLRAADRLQATEVAVGHTRDDQAETFLLRLLRGAGPRGLGGMHARSGLVSRPFIDTSRSEVRAFATSRQLRFREDASNQDVTIPRNRIRHELLPLLESRFMPNIVDVLARDATIAREDAGYLDQLAEEVASALVSATPTGVEMSRDDLLRLPSPVMRRVIRLAQQRASGGRFVGFDAVDAVLRLAVSKQTGPLDLPGHRANLRGPRVVLTRSHGRTKPADAHDFAYQLEIPGQVAVPEASCAISADKTIVPPGRTPREVWPLVGRGNEVVLEAGELSSPLSVRNRRRGDRFRPIGLGGQKSLQDYFVDLKIDRGARATVPMVVDSSGRIVWVSGHALSEEFRVTDATRDVVILKRVPI
jgi:tRNA(Ile)-lysidine synthase